MNIQDKTRLDALLQKFSSEFVIHEFHHEWRTFMNTLSKNDRSIAAKAMMTVTLENAKAFRIQATELIENGSLEDRQSISEMVNGLIEHPAFLRKRVGA
jgi:hypothetical protein